MTQTQTGPPPWESWPIDEWIRRRDHAAAYLATDPTWIMGPAVVAMCNAHIERLGGTP